MHDLENRAQLEDHFRQSDHGHVGGVGDEFNPRCFHPFSSHAVKGEVWIDPMHFPDEISTVQIAGSLSGDDHDLPSTPHGWIRSPAVEPP